MTYFNRGGDSFRGGSSYGRRDSFDRGSDRPAMFDAVCAKCGASCQVPFRPNGRKEVFCSKCFETVSGDGNRREREFGGSSRGGSYEKRDSVGTYQSDRQMFSAVCDECGDNCKIPFEPRNGKPVLCSKCFATKNGDSRENRRSESSFSSFSKQTRDNCGLDLDVVNAKLDKIIKLLTPSDPKTITANILEEIVENSGKKIVKPKKAKKKVSVKKSASKEI